MKTLIIVCMLSVLVGCAQESTMKLPSAKPCTVDKVGTLSTITCPDGSVSTVSDGSNGSVGATGPKGDTGDTGSSGSDGSNGLNGSNGHSAAISVGSADVSLCTNGGSVINLGVDSNDDTSLEISEITQTAVVCNGLNGSNGIDGTNGQDGAKGDTGSQGPAGAPSPFSATSLIAPCGIASSPWKEELLCLNNGNVLASFSDNASGLNTRFAIIPTGSYVDTDNSNCTFSVSVDVNGSTTVSWSSGSNQYSNWVSQSVTCVAN